MMMPRTIATSVRRFALPILIIVMGGSVLVTSWAGARIATAQERQRFATADSRREFTHWIELRGADGNVIDPDDPASAPYSPRTTCGKCHDYELISQGFHFSPAHGSPGRSGEPWIWTDQRTGTQLALTDRGFAGAWPLSSAGVDVWDFVQKFGRNMPGGQLTEPSENEAAEQARWHLAGRLEVDCMICHARDRSYDMQERSDQIDKHNLAWAATAAAGLADIEGSVKELDDDFDPSAAGDGEETLPKVRYRKGRFVNGKVFFDVTRTPHANACYGCHTVQRVTEQSRAEVVGHRDIHVSRGLRCADCHTNQLGHHTVRGYENEEHPTGLDVGTLSCRGCHMGTGTASHQAGGYFGAPKPLHRGLPPLHLDKLTCTACHAGPHPTERPIAMQTSLAHRLGEIGHREPSDAPQIVGPVFRRDDQGRIGPYRQFWPSFWGVMQGEKVRALSPDEAYTALRRVLRVRRDFRSEVAKASLTDKDREIVLGKQRSGVPETEWTAAERARLEKRLTKLQEQAWEPKLKQALETLAEEHPEETPVYVSSGQVTLLDSGGRLKRIAHTAATPYAWPIGHDVRPRRQSLGASGCTDCHAAGAPIAFGEVTPRGFEPQASPQPAAMYELYDGDPSMIVLWNQMFANRRSFKYFGITIWLLSLVLAYRLWPGAGKRIKSQDVRRRISIWKTIVFIVTTASIVVLAGTGFVAVVTGHALAGRWLQLHMAATGGFLLTLPIWSWRVSNVRKQFADGNHHNRARCQALSLSWYVLAGLVSAGTMLLSMLPLFGTAGLGWLLFVHRYAGLIGSVAFAVYLATYPYHFNDKQRGT